MSVPLQRPRRSGRPRGYPQADRRRPGRQSRPYLIGGPARTGSTILPAVRVRRGDFARFWRVWLKWAAALAPKAGSVTMAQPVRHGRPAPAVASGGGVSPMPAPPSEPAVVVRDLEDADLDNGFLDALAAL